MQQVSFFDFAAQYNRLDIAFFELMRSLVEIRNHEQEFSSNEIEQLKIVAKTLNAIILRQAQTPKHVIQLV